MHLQVPSPCRGYFINFAFVSPTILIVGWYLSITRIDHIWRGQSPAPEVGGICSYFQFPHVNSYHHISFQGRGAWKIQTECNLYCPEGNCKHQMEITEQRPMSANFKAGSIQRKISQWNNEVVCLTQRDTIWNNCCHNIHWVISWRREIYIKTTNNH